MPSAKYQADTTKSSKFIFLFFFRFFAFFFTIKMAYKGRYVFS